MTGVDSPLYQRKESERKDKEVRCKSDESEEKVRCKVVDKERGVKVD